MNRRRPDNSRSSWASGWSTPRRLGLFAFAIQSARCLWHTYTVQSQPVLLLGLLLSGFSALAESTNSLAVGPTPLSRVIEVAGVVEFEAARQTLWLTATNGLELKPGDRLRTRAQSRAAVQFSDRGVLRLSEDTTLEIQPPRRAEKRRFRLPVGSLFFFNREKPSDVEFETPVVSGAIRGTEFFLEAAADTGATRLAMLDGLVELAAADTTIALQSGEQARIEPGQPPVKSPLLEVASLVQWALYYPAVVNSDDLALTPEDKSALAESLAAYRAGDLLAAHDSCSKVPPGSPARELFRAALDLSVGRVDLAESRLIRADATEPVTRALREIIRLVRGDEDTEALLGSPQTGSGWLARSYSLQARFKIREALHAARQSAAFAPQFGFAHARIAELEMALEQRRAAHQSLDRAEKLSPRLAQVPSLRGYIYLDENDARAARVAFDQALALDAALDNALLGRGLALIRLGRREEGLRSIQAAAALNPRRAISRSYLAKAFSDAGESSLAEKDFRLAKELDPGDPTAWLYSALHQWQQNRPNAAVHDLEHSVALNDNRQLYRSRLLLDRDRAVRSADLAVLYGDAGLPEVSLQSAASAVNDDYSNFSGHLFLANSYRALEDPNRFDLRFETPRLSELLVANLLAPAGAGNLSQILPQQEHLQFFDQRAQGASSFTQYRSSGDWQQLASTFGTVGGLSYALDAAYDSQHGQEINDWRERNEVSLQLKQRLGPQDELYFQGAFSDGNAGDVARHYDPAMAIAGLRATEQQAPNLFVGWHHAESPANHTLLLVSRLTDSFNLWNPEVTVIHLRTNRTTVQQLYGYNDNRSQFSSDFALYSAELQHLWQTEHHTLVAGGRFQTGDVESHGILTKTFTGILSDQQISEPLRRANGYLYYNWQVVAPLRLIGGFSYDHLTYPLNSELLPLTEGTRSRELLAPKAGFLLTPWRGAQWRGAYTRSLGGLFFDNSVRIEPTQVAGFNQAFRSLAPESSVGLVPGTEFETVRFSFDQTLRSGTYFGVQTDWLHSDGDRTIGVTASPFPPPLPGSGSSTRQTLTFLERNLSAYAVQLLGDGFSAGVRYRLTDGKLDTTLSQIPDSAIDLHLQEQHERSTLHQATLSLNYQHPCGFFSQWESARYLQDNSGYSNPVRPGDDFWQHNVWAGYRFPRRHAEVRVGVLNLVSQDYRLNPLNLYNALPRGRTAVVSLRLNF